GATEALAALRGRFGLAVIAPGDSARTKALVLKLPALVDEVIVCAEEGCAPPPEPDALALAAERVGAAPEACLVVGDDPDLDGLAAQAFGAGFCRVLSGRFRDVEAG